MSLADLLPGAITVDVDVDVTVNIDPDDGAMPLSEFKGQLKDEIRRQQRRQRPYGDEETPL